MQEALVITFFLFFLSCSPKTPVILSIDPKIGKMGEVITLTGSNFGEARVEAYVTIAGTAPTNSSYHLWQNDKIVVRIPETGESGLIYVHIGRRKSNGVLFSNLSSVPKPIEGEEFGLEPRINSVSPQTGAPGMQVTITGNNFGGTREGSGVYFSWDYETPSINPFAVNEPEFIEVSDTELGYEYWSMREIRVRIPDGVVSGNLEIKTPHGKSRPVFFDISGKPGVKTFKEKRSYTVSYSVDIRTLEAQKPNTLYLWIPKPITSPSQRNVSLISRSMEPFIENYRGVSLFKMESLVAGASQTINLSYRVEVYTAESGMRPLSVKQEQSPLHAMYTQGTALIPSDNERIKAATSGILGREQNPYVKARLIYDWILENIFISQNSFSPDIITALEQKQADPCSAVLLYTAMLRAAGLPCIPVAGVLVPSERDRGGQTLHHYWTELWIADFGWLPVDPVMGAGAVPSIYISKQDTGNYYFGSMDNMRIAFSRGEPVLSQMESRGRLVSHTKSYSLQNIWEEAAGGLESYSSLWGDITISGIY
ncbi:MAG: IPT/TIG domain-containing protein [Treponema sp.]|nr:IPT/TIG domain-containing protein [Treponema sp.]